MDNSSSNSSADNPQDNTFESKLLNDKERGQSGPLDRSVRHRYVQLFYREDNIRNLVFFLYAYA